MKFSDLPLDELLYKGIADAGFTDCMPVQTMTLEQTLQGKDVLVQSQTGSGKTIAFLISILQNMLKDNDPKKKALIIVPTRELAVQIETEANLLNTYCKFLIGCFYGGVGYDKQQRLLQNNVKIIIGTPGRLIDFNKSKKLNFRDFSQLIIDEADRLFDMGFYEDIQYMLGKMLPNNQRHTMLFSATLSDRAKWIAGKFMNDPVEISIQPDNITVDSIIQELYHVGKDEKFNLLLGLLKNEKYENVLIFTNTKRTAEKIAYKLNHNDIEAQFIIGDLPQKKRIQILDDMKAGTIKLLIATNVAARGIHIDDLDLVINYDIPEEFEDYVHRIGRTARAGKTGKAITLACEEFVYGLDKIEEYIKMKIPSIFPEEDMFLEDKSPDYKHSYNKRTEKRTRDKKPDYSRKSQDNRKHFHKKKETAASNHDQSYDAKKSEKRTDKTHTHIKKEHTRKHSTTNKQQQGSYTHKKKPASVDSRLDYYREKYGEDFTIKSDTTKTSATPNDKKQKSLLQKVKSFFKKK